MKMNLEPYEKVESVLRSSMAQERMYNLALLNTEQDIFHKMDFTDIIDLLTAAKPGKECLDCFVLRTCNFGYRSNLLLHQNLFCCQFNFKKYSFSNFCHFWIFKSHIWIQS